VKTLLKSVHIHQSYCKKNLAQFFLAHPVDVRIGESCQCQCQPAPRRRLPTTKAGFPSEATHATWERNELTSLLDRPITAASDDGVCRWHAAKLWQTHAIKYETIEIKFDLQRKFHNK